MLATLSHNVSMTILIVKKVTVIDDYWNSL